MGPLTRRRTWTSLLYLVVAAPISILWLLVVTAGLLVGTATAVIGIGLPLLIATLALIRYAADLDRRLVNTLLDANITTDPPGAHQSSVTGWARDLVQGSATWRSLGWLLFRAVAGGLVLLGLAAAIVILLGLLAVPFSDGYLRWGDSWRSTSGWANAWTIPVGLIGLLGCLHLIPLVADVQVRVADVLLSPDPADERDALQADAGRADARGELARDLHDSLGHSLTLVVMQAEAARVVVASSTAEVSLTLQQIASTARSALDELDAALSLLRDETAAQRPTASLSDLSRLLDGAQRAGLPVDLQISGDLEALPAATSVVGFRVVQEACTNVLRHAGSTPTRVRIVIADDAVRIEIRNRIVGQERTPGRFAAPVRAGTGRGLVGLAERVRLAGGRLEAGPVADGDHWDVVAILPFLHHGRGTAR